MHIRGNRFNTNTLIVFVVVSQKQNSEKNLVFLYFGGIVDCPCVFSSTLQNI